MRLHGEAGEWWLAAPHFSCSCWASLPPGCQSRQPLLSMHLPPGTPCIMHIPCGSTQRMRYGFLTCHRYTYFLKFVGPKQYAITGAFLATATNPSVAAILFCECQVPGRSTTAAGGVCGQTPGTFHMVTFHMVTFQQSSMPIMPLVEAGSCVIQFSRVGLTFLRSYGGIGNSVRRSHAMLAVACLQTCARSRGRRAWSRIRAQAPP